MGAPSADVARVYMLLDSAWYLYKEATAMVNEAAEMFANETESARWVTVHKELRHLTFATMRLAALFEASPTGKKIANDYRKDNDGASKTGDAVLHDATTRTTIDSDDEGRRRGIAASVPKGDE
jgi:hypothetical protein